MTGDRKTEILTVAAELLEQKSFRAFSYQDLAHRLGVTKASIHHHFGTKEELGVALLEHYDRNADALAEEIRGRAKSPGDLLRLYLELAEDVLLNGRYQVCPMAGFQVDLDDLPQPIQRRLQALLIRHNEMLAEGLSAARVAGEAQFLGSAQDQAALVIAALHGAKELARNLGPGLFRGVVAQLKRSMGA